MKVECNIIRDLMVLYELENCSEESIQMIKNHIEECEECRKIWESKTGETIEKVVNEVKQDEGKEEFDKLRKKVRRKNIVIILVAAIVLSFFMYKGYQYVTGPVDCAIEDMEFSNFHKADGAISFKVTLTDGRGFGDAAGYFSSNFASQDDAVQIGIYRSRFSRKTTKESEISMYVSVPGLDGKVNEIYYGEGEEKTLIWEKGDPISELTDEIREDIESLQAGNN